MCSGTFQNSFAGAQSKGSHCTRTGVRGPHIGSQITLAQRARPQYGAHENVKKPVMSQNNGHHASDKLMERAERIGPHIAGRADVRVHGNSQIGFLYDLFKSVSGQQQGQLGGAGPVACRRGWRVELCGHGVWPFDGGDAGHTGLSGRPGAIRKTAFGNGGHNRG